MTIRRPLFSIYSGTCSNLTQMKSRPSRQAEKTALKTREEILKRWPQITVKFKVLNNRRKIQPGAKITTCLIKNKQINTKLEKTSTMSCFRRKNPSLSTFWSTNFPCLKISLSRGLTTPFQKLGSRLSKDVVSPNMLTVLSLSTSACTISCSKTRNSPK